MILLLGASGYVGSAFAKYVSKAGKPVLLASRREHAYHTREGLSALLKQYKPDVIINTAGYTGKPNVDACERDRAACLEGNAVLPGVVAEVARDFGIPWGHVSSGCIFSGEGPDDQGFREDDAPNFCFRSAPCSFYSGTKALGEEALGYREVDDGTGRLKWLADQEDGYIWRLRIPFNHEANPRNYLYKLNAYERLLVATNSLSHLEEFVGACLECFEKQVPYGIYNLTNPGRVTTQEVTAMMEAENARRLERGDKAPFRAQFNFFDDEAEFMSKAASTPRSNCVMNTTKAQEAGIHMSPVHEIVQQSLREWSAA